MSPNDVASTFQLVQQYAHLRERVGGITASVRGMRFNQLIADALQRDGIEAEADARGPRGEIDVAFAHDGTWYLLEAKWEAAPIDADPVRKLHDVVNQRRPGSMGVLVSWSGFNDSALRRAAEARNIILFGRNHIEALLSGVVTAQEVISTANRAISVFGQEHAELATLLRPRRPIAAPMTLGVPDGFTPAAVAAPNGIDADVLAHGPGILGIASHADRLLITVQDGVVDVAPRKSRVRRRLELTGCEGPSFVDADGLLLVTRGGGVIRQREEEVEIAAGGFARTPLIVLGRESAPWLLDRSTVGWPGNQPGHLVEPGARLGDDHRYPAALPAASCANACWMRADTFFVLGNGHSAIVDVRTGEFTWIVTPIGRPRGLVRLDERRVLVTGSDRHLQAALIDTGSGQASEPIAVNLAGHVGDALVIGTSLYVVAGAPVSSSVVVPVVACLDLDKIVRLADLR